MTQTGRGSFPCQGYRVREGGIEVNPVGQCVGGPEEAKERVFQEAREARKGREQCANDGGTEGHGTLHLEHAEPRLLELMVGESASGSASGSVSGRVSRRVGGRVGGEGEGGVWGRNQRLAG